MLILPSLLFLAIKEQPWKLIASYFYEDNFQNGIFRQTRGKAVH
jgi:hypothetical protein